MSPGGISLPSRDVAKQVPRLPELPGRAAATVATGRYVLVFHSGALGDFILTWPIVLGIARIMAQSRTIVITGGDKGRLAEEVLRVEHRDAESGWHGLFGDGRLPDKPKKLLAGARQLVSFVADAGDTWAANAGKAAPGAECVFIKPPPRELQDEHASDFLLKQLESNPVLHAAAAGLRESQRKTGLMPRLHDPKGPVLLHPGSGSPKKTWPAESWVALAEQFKSQGRRVRVVLGEVERERPELANAFDDLADVQRPADLSELLFLLRGAGGFVGHDSGPTHLAAAVGLPTVACFTDATDPAVWSPVGPSVRVHQDDPASLDPSAV